ncbi:hypothetical protein DVH24_001585, partial [Malus domestica]
FKKLSNVFPPIPRHQFFLQDYNTLYPYLNKVDILTGDIIIHEWNSSLLHYGQILQRIFVLHLFTNCKEPIKILAPSSRQVNEVEVLRTAKKLTIEELTFLDPDLYKREATIAEAQALGAVVRSQGPLFGVNV